MLPLFRSLFLWRVWLGLLFAMCSLYGTSDCQDDYYYQLDGVDIGRDGHAGDYYDDISAGYGGRVFHSRLVCPTRHK